jgi:FlgN protein
MFPYSMLTRKSHISWMSRPDAVESDSARYLELLEKRILSLDALSDSLSAANNSIVAFDLEGLECRIAQQEGICMEIRSLDAHIDQVQQQCAAQLSVNGNGGSGGNSDSARIREAVARLSEVQNSVRRLNEAHQVLLRRSRRTVTALLNSYNSFAMTYGDPLTAQASAGERA